MICGSSFSVELALDCRVGGLVGRCHNEVQDVVCDLATLAWSQVKKELFVKLVMMIYLLVKL